MALLLKKRVAALLVCATLLAGCGTGGEGPSSAPDPSAQLSAPSGETQGMPDKDRAGNDIRVPDKLDRIISTAPSNTEILIGLGLGDKLVAVDEYSADVEGVDPTLPQINFRGADAEALVELDPDIIIASGHNSSGGDDPFALLKEAGICVATIPSSDSIQGICDDILFIARITGTEGQGQEIVDGYLAQVEEIRKIGAAVPVKKRVYFEIAPAPDLSSFGQKTFLNEFIEVVGAENIFADQEGWLMPSAESVVERNPEVILTNVGYVDNAVDAIKTREGWDAVSAVADGRVYQVDTNSAARPSQLSIKALWQIARAIYPELYA